MRLPRLEGRFDDFHIRNPARFCLPTAARSAPISTHVI